MSTVLQVRALTAGYGSSVVLRGIDLDVGEGEVVCLMGRNGAGKTTMLKSLMGVLRKRGTVKVDGIDVSDWPGHRINAAGVAWVPQDEATFPGLTVREHLRLAFGDRGFGRAAEAAVALFPILGERMEQEAQTLSGGERKMLGIGTAFALKPRIVLMDEPTEGVAPVVVEQLIPAIRTLSQTSAVLLVEQNVDTAVAVGVRASILEHGEIVETGEVARLHAEGILERRLSL